MNKFSKWKERLTRQFEAGKAKVELHAAPPTYPADDSMPVEEARQKLDQHIDDFIRVAAEWNAEHRAADTDDEANPFQAYAEQVVEAPLSPPPVQALRVSTGVGKTQRFAARLAHHIGDAAWLYLVPTHRLGEDIAKQFEDHGLTARVYRGRAADDPTIPGYLEHPKNERVKMCLNLEQVKLAMSCGKDITKSCCKNKQQQCAFYDECGYQHQLRGNQPDVWIAAHNMLYHPQKKFGEVVGVVIDETFYKKGISGIESHGDDLTLEDISIEDYPWRKDLVQILQAHPLGGLERARFSKKWDPSQLKFVIGVEWNIVNSLKLTPRMTAAELAAVKEKMPACRRARRMVGIWGALRELLNKPEIKVSGRLVLDQNKKGQTVLRLRSVRPIVKSWQVPTAILDATLPEVSILRPFYPQVVVVADLRVDMPHVRIRQVVGAPVSKLKLWGTEKKPAIGQHNLQAVRHYILARWLETERKPMLVICQMQAEEWLKNSGLPVGIVVEHLNNIGGLDRYKHVRSLILIGRTIPSPVVVEAYAGALTGAEPLKVVTTGNWYDRITRGIRLAGGGIGVECDEHPDPVGEAVRWQICEAELMQALGRARGVNRTAETPLQVDILADVVLPVAVNEVIPWQEPSSAVEMAVEGIELTSPGDMAKAWPGVWPTAEAAKWTLKKLRALYSENVLSFPTAERAANKARSVFSIVESIYRKNTLSFLYTTAATKFRRTGAFFDPRILPNPRAWLEKRLGVLASLFHLVRKGEIAPVAGKVGFTVNDRLVTVLKPEPRETLDQLFDRAAQKPSRPLSDRKTLYGTAKATSEWIGSSRTGTGARTYCPARATQEFLLPLPFYPHARK